MFRINSSNVVALEDRCCHRGLPLSKGVVVGSTIQCSYHGLKYDCSGACVHIPNQEKIPSSARVKSFSVVEQDGLVWVWLGAAEGAQGQNPDRYKWHTEEKWAHKGKKNYTRAPASMLIDNLLDLSHVGYVHGGTIGVDPKSHSAAEMNYEPTAWGIVMSRKMRDAQPPSTYVAAAGFQGKIDRWSDTEFRPAYITISAGAKDVNQGAFEGNQEGAFWLKSLHAITPETESTTHYFWTISHRVRDDMPGLTEFLFQEIDKTFAEDKEVIEAQSNNLLRTPDRPLIDVRADGPSLLARRLIKKWKEQEREQSTSEGTSLSAL
ncbi:vanillate O-demethylase monooxygenase subunit [Variovorax sp. PDC80]|nr:vanillate O-demethylase monooxygenase subunit [Variovorax sp. PDC80]